MISKILFYLKDKRSAPEKSVIMNNLQNKHIFLCIFRWDLNLPVVLDFEIWKASNMLFQHIPNNGDVESDTKESSANNWDDSWYEYCHEEKK